MSRHHAEPVRTRARAWGPIEYRHASIPGAGSYRLLRVTVGEHEVELCWSHDPRPPER